MCSRLRCVGVRLARCESRPASPLTPLTPPPHLVSAQGVGYGGAGWGGGWRESRCSPFRNSFQTDAGFFFVFFSSSAPTERNSRRVGGEVRAVLRLTRQTARWPRPPLPPSTAAARRKQACRRSPAFPGELQPITRRISGLPAPDGTPAQRDELWEGSVFIFYSFGCGASVRFLCASPPGRGLRIGGG